MIGDNSNPKTTVTIGCHISGNPKPQIKWLYNGSDLSDVNPYLSNVFNFEIIQIKGTFTNVFSKLEIKVNNIIFKLKIYMLCLNIFFILELFKRRLEFLF